ncbi:hypothetical protein IMZ08_18975 [Bacillus luteolus]|uniref:Uncharacterized protein n=1 Tax=Litchfieldia luteola TaxID=682179 RepID=A0ABR9QPL9_9BACI|nr:hypothetical protein [Cytobacillus luteolus]MBE4910124.1 hypothetical protein [Cytobacillus luteolus]MBP1942312.1 hypothetical protein [Cytobacillus luteolus]
MTNSKEKENDVSQIPEELDFLMLDDCHTYNAKDLFWKELATIVEDGATED